MDLNSGLAGGLMIIERTGTLLSHCFLSRNVEKIKFASLNLDALCDPDMHQGTYEPVIILYYLKFASYIIWIAIILLHDGRDTF